jgi:hypothetical protein
MQIFCHKRCRCFRSRSKWRSPTSCVQIKKTVSDTRFYIILVISLCDVVKTGVFPWPVYCRKMSQFVVKCCWSAIPETCYDIEPPPQLPATYIWHGCWRQISEFAVGRRHTNLERRCGARGKKKWREKRDGQVKMNSLKSVSCSVPSYSAALGLPTARGSCGKKGRYCTNCLSVLYRSSLFN